jgi:hypothetical protein
MPHRDRDPPELGLERLVPPPGGMARLLAKRTRRQRRLLIQNWLPVAACAASLLLVSMVLRGPSLDVDEVRRQLTGRGTTLQIEDSQPMVIEQRAVAGGVHMYSVRAR